jgi:hypothetical protein
MAVSSDWDIAEILTLLEYNVVAVLTNEFMYQCCFSHVVAGRLCVRSDEAVCNADSCATLQFTVLLVL